MTTIGDLGNSIVTEGGEVANAPIETTVVADDPGLVEQPDVFDDAPPLETDTTAASSTTPRANGVADPRLRTLDAETVITGFVHRTDAAIKKIITDPDAVCRGGLSDPIAEISVEYKLILQPDTYKSLVSSAYRKAILAAAAEVGRLISRSDEKFREVDYDFDTIDDVLRPAQRLATMASDYIQAADKHSRKTISKADRKLLEGIERAEDIVSLALFDDLERVEATHSAEFRKIAENGLMDPDGLDRILRDRFSLLAWQRLDESIEAGPNRRAGRKKREQMEAAAARAVEFGANAETLPTNAENADGYVALNEAEHLLARGRIKRAKAKLEGARGHLSHEHAPQSLVERLTTLEAELTERESKKGSWLTAVGEALTNRAE